MIKKKCIFCKKEFEVKPSPYDRMKCHKGPSKYICKDCFEKHGEEFMRQKQKKINEECMDWSK